jgi:hypothetical protein
LLSISNQFSKFLLWYAIGGLIESFTCRIRFFGSSFQ